MDYKFTNKLCVFCHQKLSVTQNTKVEELDIAGGEPFMVGSCPHCGGSNRLEAAEKPKPKARP